MEQCPCCGHRPRLDVLDIDLHTREITLDACCEENLSGWIDSMPWFTRRERASWVFRQTGLQVHDVVSSGDTLQWTLDFGLTLDTIAFAAARDFIAEHHRHCDPPVGWMYGASLRNGADLVGVVIAGRPNSRILAAKGCIEITRVCVRDLYPRSLVKNACSILYGYACREAFKRGCTRVVTYTRKGESGASLRAAGFTPVAKSRGGPWNRKGRPRKTGRNTGPKIRWERWKGQQLPFQQQIPFADTEALPLAA